MTYLLVVATFLLMLMGGYVKAIGAGLSCPDWPLCYGQVFPFLQGDVYAYTPWMIFSEWFHRLWASMVGLFMLAMLYWSFSYNSKVPLLFRLSILCVLLFGVQVILGGLTVIMGLNQYIVVFHLGNAILIIMMEMTIAFVATVNSNITFVAPTNTSN